MIEEIRPNLFRLEIPLPETPLKAVNSYVIRGGDENLIVDTGLNRPECLEAMLAGLAELEIDLARTRFFITHLHADHFGLVGRLVTDPSRVYFSQPEAEIIESWTGWEPMVAYAARSGFPENELRAALQSHPGYKYASKWAPGLSRVVEGDRIQVGGYLFVCLETPGHTNGHVCLYEPDRQLFIAGDHVLGDITPNIQCWADEDNNLADYLRSLDKVAALDVVLTLPGHRSLIHDLKGRVAQIKEHHERRADEVLEILRLGPRHAFGTAAEMTWDLTGAWADFPLAQKWFAAAEASAHLRYLEAAGEIGRDETTGIILYHL